MNSRKGIGLLVGNWGGVVDHLLPLCQVMDIPLILTEPTLYQMAQFFYPSPALKLWNADEKSFDNSFLEQYNFFCYTAFCRLPHGTFRFFDALYHGKGRSLFCFHGNSDKRRTLYWIEQLADEDIVLLYGPHMVDFVKEKGIWPRINQVILTGNYRYEYYQKNKLFFNKKIDALLPLDPSRKTLLYAPTWSQNKRCFESRIDYSNFFEVYPYIFDALPSNYRLIVKWHPLFLENYGEAIETLEQKYKQIIFLRDFPLIYPLLERVDYYLGDYSSIGYDFLFYNRPLFFLNHSKREDKGVFLYRCGVPLESSDLPKLYSIIEKTNPKTHEEQRIETYTYAFGERKPLESLKNEISCALTS